MDAFLWHNLFYPIVDFISVLAPVHYPSTYTYRLFFVSPIFFFFSIENILYIYGQLHAEAWRWRNNSL